MADKKAATLDISLEKNKVDVMVLMLIAMSDAVMAAYLAQYLVDHSIDGLVSHLVYLKAIMLELQMVDTVRWVD